MVIRQSKINSLKKKLEEPTESDEVNMLTKKKNELQKYLNKFNKKIENNTMLGQKQLSLLCAITKRIQTVRLL